MECQAVLLKLWRLARRPMPGGLCHLTRLWTAKQRATQRLRDYGLSSHLLGLWLRRKFQRAGIIIVRGGWPLPQVDNRGGQISVGNCAFFSGVRLECWPGATITIGHGTYLNRNTEIVASQRVTIGQDCKIARDVIIMDTDQHALPFAGLVAKPVEIGDRVWIGSRAIVLKGVTIGNDCIIGAGAVVTKSVPPASVVVGPAARAIRTLPSGASVDSPLIDRSASVRHPFPRLTVISEGATKTATV